MMLMGEKMSSGFSGGGGVTVQTQEGDHKDKAFTWRSSYLPFVPLRPFPSTLFIVTFTLLRPVAETKEGGNVDE